MSTLVKLTADMQRILNEQRLGFVASVCEDGTPNLSPKGTTTVWDDEHLVFADICSTRGPLPISAIIQWSRSMWLIS